MHVAICDDNGADRKQMERLLKRESDKRASTTGVLYVDSYGNVEALLANALMYDLFYIDLCMTPGVSVADVVDALAKKGSTAPIVLCSSKINYREQTFPENIFFLDKAIKVSELSESIDKALEIKSEAPNVIELRNEAGTIYVTEDEILYAVTKSRAILVTLTNGRTQEVRTDIYNLYSQLAAEHDCYLPPTGHFILNCLHIKKLGALKAIMSDGKSFLLSRTYHQYAEIILNAMKEAMNEGENE
ncbi:MAG: hypothetical protein J6Z22_08255 [Lachnospiraceae bacterium]|nr:hypothetical protein [Lachnospiraceae bacterium]